MILENKYFMTQSWKQQTLEAPILLRGMKFKIQSHVMGILVPDTNKKYLEKYKMGSDFPEVSWRKPQVALLKPRVTPLTFTPLQMFCEAVPILLGFGLQSIYVTEH